mgnify:CR=1 FL=1
MYGNQRRVIKDKVNLYRAKGWVVLQEDLHGQPDLVLMGHPAQGEEPELEAPDEPPVGPPDDRQDVYG